MANRAASAAGGVSPSAPHIPSIPGKSGRVVTDPRTGFTRGTAPLTPSEERQRQFLEAHHGTEYKDKMPDDLLQFLKDMGPVQSKVEPQPQTQGHRPSRAPRLLPNKESEATKETKPGHDPTRKVVAMPLASQIPEYETMRTTSFSHKEDEDTSENDAIGANVVQLYSLVSGKTSIHGHLLLKTPEDSAVDTELQGRMEQALKYIAAPALLKDLEDGGYVGAWPHKVAHLQAAHKDMLIELDTKTRAKLVLEDLWETEPRRAPPAGLQIQENVRNGPAAEQAIGGLSSSLK